MSWRVVSIANKAHLSLRQDQLLIRQDEEFSVPLEDIGVLLIENQAVTTSMALLNACVQHRIAVLVCDDKHMPSGVLQGYQQHSRQTSVITAQFNLSEPLRKRLWQTIVKQKIQNQKYLFERVTNLDSSKFDFYSKSVNSGDTLNREATAARLYFDKLLPQGEVRSSDTVTNHALNYGYAVIRGAMARSLTSYGFLTSLGINHRSELNNFALADDLMEPYRQIVDQLVFLDFKDQEVTSLEKGQRDSLVSLLIKRIKLGEKEYTIQRAMEMTAKSLVTAIKDKDIDQLLLPDLKTCGL